MAEAESAYRYKYVEEQEQAYGYGNLMRAEGYPLRYGTYPEWEREEERIRRTRERPRPKAQPRRKPKSSGGLTVAELKQIMAVTVFVALLLIGVLVLNAYAASLQCSINTLTKKNLQIQDEIDVLNMEIDSSTSIEQIESYAMKNLNMSYPKSGQVIYISKGTQVEKNFAQKLKEKAYGES
jgi:cell division protein FtsL